jgi:hypothetical protein
MLRANCWTTRSLIGLIKRVHQASAANIREAAAIQVLIEQAYRNDRRNAASRLHW